MKFYNSLSQKKEEFKSLKDKIVKIYVCGITPYDTTHFGHAFTYMVFDVLVRYLRFKGYKVKYVQNVTDIDDDILKRAKEQNKNWQELGDFWTNKFLSDLKALNILLPDVYCKATKSITMMIRIIRVLIEKGFAYEKNGNVYFDIKKFEDYGKLSRYNEKQMILLSKERGANPNDSLKKNPLDFILWQKSKSDEPFWHSPFGDGRPGWHIECSAMIKQFLGDQIDIHGGGKDLIFPHHESEIAQSESYTNKKPFVKFWIHTAMVMYQGKKMAKSLGNLVMISDLLKKYSANEIRLMLLLNHYRSPWEYTNEKIIKAKNLMKIIKAAVPDVKIRKEKSLSEFEKIMDDNLNTPSTIDYLVNLSKIIVKEKNKAKKKSLQKILLGCLFVLGFKN